MTTLLTNICIALQCGTLRSNIRMPLLVMMYAVPDLLHYPDYSGCVCQPTDLMQAMNYSMGAWQSPRVELRSA